MKEYNVYCLDYDGRNVEARSIAAASDKEAIRQARALKGLRQCEVWRGHHLMARIIEFDHVS